jgi:hypothetical protein
MAGSSEPWPRAITRVRFNEQKHLVAVAPRWRNAGSTTVSPPSRRYVRECLRERTDLRLLEAATVTAAVALAAYHSPELLVVDEPERDVLVTLPQLRAIVIVDDVPHGAPGVGTRLRLLARPFTTEGLVAEVGQLLG